jgi:DNA-binding transcriptional LysR family regulator
MTFTQLYYVLETSRIGSISKAARHLLLTQSNLSGVIRSLEKELGLKLFIRNKDGVSLTDRGKSFIFHVNTILESYHELTQLNAREYTEPFMVSIMRSSFALNAFMKFYNQYRASKGLRVLMQNFDIDRDLEQLQGGVLDFVVSAGGLSSKYQVYKRFKEKKLQIDALGTLPVNLYLRKGHPLLEGCNPVEPEKGFNFQLLAKYPYVDYLRNTSAYNLSNLTLQETYNLFSVDPNHVILVSDLTQKDKFVCETDAFSIGMARAPFQQNHNVINIPLPNCHMEIFLSYLPSNPFCSMIEEYRVILMDELATCADFNSLSNNNQDCFNPT